jgi:hypothetical protein
MLARALSCAMVGLDSALVEVEVDLSQGLPAYNIVGLPDTVVNEAKERVRAAIRNSGLQFPMRRITVNLAPADLRKEGPAYSFLYPCRFLALGYNHQPGRLFQQDCRPRLPRDDRPRSLAVSNMLDKSG